MRRRSSSQWIDGQEEDQEEERRLGARERERERVREREHNKHDCVLKQAPHGRQWDAHRDSIS
eukprot:9492359-Pyramimonas_sp.AAC.1